MSERDDEVRRMYRKRVRQINAWEKNMRARSDDALRSVTDKLKAHLQTDTEEQPSNEQGPIPFRSSRKQNAPDDRR